MKKFLRNFICGALIGVAAIIPGFSGGTVAALLNIYEELIESISNFKKHIKYSILFLIPIILGILIFALAAIVPITWGLRSYPFITISLFAGMQLGGIPTFQKAIKGKANKINILWFTIGFLVVLGIVLGSFFLKDSNVITLIDPPLYMYFILFLSGVIASIALVLPGISGSMVLLLFGLYVPIMDTIKGFFVGLGLASNTLGTINPIILEVASSPNYLWQVTLLLFSFGIGLIAGIIIASKALTYLFAKFKIQTYFVIFGLIISSFLGIYINDKLYVDFNCLQLIFGIASLTLGFFISFIPEKILEKKEQKKQEIKESKTEQLLIK